ncbi:NUDIX domain-containing protein [Candidatus Woesebacteria bacterium]|nr:NUDIX domain-containing protein [Candidatus Woesebacteria bacterium]
MIQPKICITAAGVLVWEEKVLLVKHKKLGIWLNPGGHVEADELPHHAAEREFFEETGVKVVAYTSPVKSSIPFDETMKLGAAVAPSETPFLPLPISCNLHWVSHENYLLRTQQGEKMHKNSVWQRGCEQHCNFLYLVRPVAGLDLVENQSETLGIGWFTSQQIGKLEIKENILTEIVLALQLAKTSC